MQMSCGKVAGSWMDGLAARRGTWVDFSRCHIRSFPFLAFAESLRPKAETETHTEGLTRSQSRAQINQFYLAQTHWSPAGTVVAYLLGLAKK